MKFLIILVVLMTIMSFEGQAQERLNCNEYYLSVGSDYQAVDDNSAALSYYFKQRKYYPGCPETEIALYNSIEIYHEKIMHSKGAVHTAEARSLVIEFSEISDDSAMIADVKLWWADIEAKEKEVMLTATVFWEIVGSAVLIVLYFTAAGN